tara:strand:+ start:458 stop:1093 length:636 start_codon:yes stop_codon:yes gene_type:complete
MLIGVVGLIGSGKGTVADRLEQKHGFRKDSFAKSLKDAVSSMFNWDRELLEGKGNASREWREQPDKFWSEKFGKEVTPRWVLQYFGTEVMRGQMLDTIWIDSCLMRYDGKPTVIADTRFQNELKMIQKSGGKIILVKRGELPTREEMQEKGAHKSEWDWMGWNFDFVIENNGTKEELYEKVDDLIVSNKITHTPTETPDPLQPLAIGANSF